MSLSASFVGIALWVCTGEGSEINSDTVESLGLTGSRKLGRSRQFGEIFVGDVHAFPLLLTLKERRRGFINARRVEESTDDGVSPEETSPETHRVQRQRRTEAFLVYSLQQSFRVSVGAVQDQHLFTCGRRNEFSRRSPG